MPEVRPSRRRLQYLDRPVPPPDAWPAWAERRDSPRRTPLESRAWLGWWDGRDFRAQAVRLVDISQGGAAIETEVLPPKGRPCWFRLARPEAAECVGATAVWIGAGRRGAYRVGLAFEGLCPEGDLPGGGRRHRRCLPLLEPIGSPDPSTADDPPR